MLPGDVTPCFHIRLGHTVVTNEPIVDARPL